MSRQASIRHADLKRMAAVAAEYGVCVEAELRDMIIRVMPSGTHRVNERKLSREEEADEALNKWLISKGKTLKDW